MPQFVNSTPILNTHPLDHNLAGHNVKAMYGAVGDGTTDDTTPFVNAIDAIKAGSVGGQKLVVPAGLYIVDGDQILDKIYNQNGWLIEGAGKAATVIKAKASASRAFGWELCEQMTVRGITFDGAGKGGGRNGFTMMGNGRDHMFSACRFQNSQIGFETKNGVKGGGDLSQNERNTFMGCTVNDNTTGYYINTVNSQGQLFLGGGGAGNDVGFHGVNGWAEFHSWFIASSGNTQTGWKTVPGWTSTELHSCLDEGLGISFDLGGGYLLAAHTYFQGATNTIKTTVQQFIDCTYCRFATGVFKCGDDTVFYDRQNDWSAAGAFDPGLNATRHQWAGNGGYYTYIEIGTDNWTVHRRFLSPLGFQDHVIAVAPASPPANYLRVYHDASSGKMTAKDSGGTNHDFY